MKPILIRGCLLACAFSAAAVEPVRPGGFIVGVCTHFSQGKGLLEANLSLIRQSGARSIRDEVVWSGVEREKGQLKMPAEWEHYVRRAAAEGLDPMLILDYGNKFYDNGDKPLSEEALEGFTRYSEFVVKTFKGVVRHYEIWNEWDIKIGGTTPGSPESYANLVKRVYPRIKAVDASITVYGGSMTPGAINNGWFEKVLEAGALASMDAVSIHTYNYGRQGRERTPEAWAEWIERTQEMIARYNGGRQAPLYITEMGWPTQVDRRGSPPRLSADYLARMYLLSRTMPFLKGIWWYDFQDDGWRAEYNEHNFGLVRPDLSPKPSLFALASVAELVAKAEFTGRVDAGDPDIYVLKFREPDGRDSWAVWSAHEDDDWQLTLKCSRANRQPVRIQQAGAPALQRPWGHRNWAGEKNAPVIPDELTLVVRGTPWIVSGDLSGVSVSGVTRRPFPEAARASLVSAPAK